jgi:hypothetical protein
MGLKPHVGLSLSVLGLVVFGGLTIVFVVAALAAESAVFGTIAGAFAVETVKWARLVLE